MRKKETFLFSLEEEETVAVGSLDCKEHDL